MGYFQKYVGQYRVKCHIDKNTNDFPREFNSSGSEITYSDNDLYIPCASKCEITYYGKGILEFYCPSKIRYNNIIKQLPAEIIIESFESSSEGWFRFKAKDLDTVAEIVKPSTYGASIRPHSKKNLPKTKYDIPEEELKLYKNIIKWDELSDDDKIQSMQMIKSLNKQYLQQLNKSRKKNENSIETDMRLQGFNNIKEYSHFIGTWSDYIKFLKTNYKLN